MRLCELSPLKGKMDNLALLLLSILFLLVFVVPAIQLGLVIADAGGFRAATSPSSPSAAPKPTARLQNCLIISLSFTLLLAICLQLHLLPPALVGCCVALPLAAAPVATLALSGSLQADDKIEWVNKLAAGSVGAACLLIAYSVYAFSGN